MKKAEPAYQLQSVATGGFLRPDKEVEPDATCCGSVTLCGMPMTRFRFEPSPLTAGQGGYALFGLFYGVILHVLAIIFTTYAATWSLKHEDHLTKHTHTVDFVSSWLWVAVAGQWIATGLTIFYYGLFPKASLWPLPGSIALGLQLAATVSNIKLAYFAAIDDRANETLNENADWAVVTGMYVQLLLIAAYIMTPISGTYYKHVRPTF